MTPRRIGERLLALLSLHPNEVVRTILLTLYLFLVIASAIAIKAIRDGLFLDRFGALKLPYVIIGIAFGIGVFVAIYIRLARRLPTGVLIVGTLLFFASNLVLFWWLGVREWAWLPPVVYVWAGMYSAIAPAQVWTLANDVFTTREAKRCFGLVGAGGIAGAVLGGGAVKELATEVGTVNLIGLMAGLLVVIAAVVMVVSRYRLPAEGHVADFPSPRHLRDSLGIIRRSAHLKRIAGLVFVTAIATTLADWMFKAVASEKLSGDELTAFFGGFYGSLGIISFVVQFVLTSLVLRRFGLGRTILILPFVMLLANGWLILAVALPAAVLLKGADVSLKHSIDRSTRELAYLPVNPRFKVHVKSAIDMVVDRFGDGTAGVVLLGLTSFAGFGVRGIAVVNLAFFAVWIFLAFRLGWSYREELGRSLSEGRLEATSWSEALAGPETIETLAGLLEQGEPSARIEALDLVARNPSWDLEGPLRKLAREGEDEEIRARALAILLDPREEGVPEGIDDRFLEEDRTLMADCIDFMAAPDGETRRSMALALLDRAGGHARGAWLALMIRRLGPEFDHFAAALIEELADADSPDAAREAAATAIGLLPAGRAPVDVLDRLLRDPDPVVMAAAVRSFGRLGGADRLRGLIAHLANGMVRDEVDGALRHGGDDALPVLIEAVDDPSIPDAARRRIPGVMIGIDNARAHAAVVALFDHPDPEVASGARAALFRFRLDHPEITPLSQRAAREGAMRQVDRWGRYSGVRAALNELGPESEERSLLDAALGEAMRRARETAVRTLALHWPIRPVLDGHRAADHPDPRIRANGAELLDSILPALVWRRVSPVLYPAFASSAEVAIGPSPGDPFLALAADDDPWLRTLGAALAPSGEDAGDGEAGSEGNTLQPSGPTSVLQRVMALRRVDVFADAPTDELSRIAALARDAIVASGEEICRQGDPPGDLVILLDGRASVERDGRVLGDLGVGEAIGTWGLFDDEPRPFTVRASEDLRVLRIDRWSFDELLMDRPEVARSLARRMARRLRAVTESAAADRRGE